MCVLRIQKAEKSLGAEPIFEKLSFSIASGERIGLVGQNGSGKSTLLRILAGEDSLDSGTITFRKGLRISYLPQIKSPEPKEADSETQFFQSYFSIPTDGTLIAPSGGEITRLALSQMMGENASLLLLDEPTNHLDTEGVDLLIGMLHGTDAAALIVSHDRYFLDRTVDRIFELENGKLTEYGGNYTDYREQKKQLYEESLHRYASDQRKEKRLEEAIYQKKTWSEKAHRDSTKPQNVPKIGLKEKNRAKAKKMDKAVKNNIKRLETLRGTAEERPKEERKVHFAMNGDLSPRRAVLEADALSFSYNDEILFENSHFFVKPGEKVALYGPNGCGKTTLIKLITGELSPSSGRLWVSPVLHPYVMEQSLRALPSEEILHHFFEQEAGPLSGYARTLLNNLGLTKNHLNRKIGSLSGGEQMKVQLALPILQAQEFLILDEPTNHLDLPTREVLEGALDDFPGTVLVTSHDRYFLQKFCDKVFTFENRKIIRHEDSFADYEKIVLFQK